MENKLQVRNLRISFRTSNGKVQAVRGIDFDLREGETLAIVGESGSGKSVTSKAILGISAGNAIVESGEIIYDGQDLLKISEEDFHRIRGDKIAMIFQDPMSSLDPIVTIGHQLTEAMILKGKARQKESRRLFNTYLKNLKDTMAASGVDATVAAESCKNFDKFEFKHIELESAYNTAHEAANEAIEDIDELVFGLEHGSDKDASYHIKDIVKETKASVNEYVLKDDAAKARELAGSLSGLYKKNKRTSDFSDLISALKSLGDILKSSVGKPVPNFFRMGYYLTFSGQPLPDMPVEKLNDFLKEYLDNNFMKAFIANAKRALEHSAKESRANMAAAIDAMKTERAVFGSDMLVKRDCYDAHKRLSESVKATIDQLAITKDSLTFTFSSSLKSELDTYFGAISKNKKAMAEHDRDQRKYDAQVKRGKKPTWEVADAAVTDLDLIKENIAHLLDRLTEHYREKIAADEKRDYTAETVAVIDYLKENASGVVAKVTRRVAKDRAIRLMEEVGIAEPHKRYNQYPFEFSGGMRQRIVIAIALAANPDILICDEPTTALDVTIQSQILELINKLKVERNLSVIFITHDLGVVANMADNVAVMYAGKIVEYGTSEDIFYRAAHPYTWALLSSMPDLDTNEKLESIPGTPPNMIYPPKGDAFAPRNKYAMAIDFERQPPMFKISETHSAATWLLHPDAPKVEPPKILRDRIERMSRGRKTDNAEQQ